MSKLTDAVVTTLKGYFETGDQPTAAQFAALIDGVQQGIEEHDHNEVGDGDAANVPAAGISNRTRRVLLPANYGVIYHAGVDSTPIVTNHTIGLGIDQDEWGAAMCRWQVPVDFVSGLTVKAVVLPPGGGGDVYVTNTAEYLAVGEDWDARHSAEFAAAAVSVTQDIVAEIGSLSLSSAAVGDYVGVKFERDGTNVLDTLSGELIIVGWVAEYTADS